MTRIIWAALVCAIGVMAYYNLAEIGVWWTSVLAGASLTLGFFFGLKIYGGK